MIRKKLSERRKFRGLIFAVIMLLGWGVAFGSSSKSFSSGSSITELSQPCKERPVIVSSLCRVLKGCPNGASI